MGNTIQVKKDGVKILEKEREGESAIYRSDKMEGLIENYFPDVTTLYENFQHGVKNYPSNNCLGWREGEGPYKWLTYQQVNQRVMNFGSGLINLGLKPKSFVGIYSINRVEWVLSEQACNAFSMTIVPLYDTLGADTCEYIINEVELPVVICTADKAKPLFDSAPKTPSLKYIITIGDISDDLKDAFSKQNITVVSFDEIEKQGSEDPQKAIPPQPEDLATICYTSGTTGNPKGAMLTHKNHIACASGGIKHSLLLKPTDIHISYLPLAHVFERTVQIVLFGFGCSLGFFRGDVLKLMDDIAVLKPTIFCSVPRLYNRIYDKVMAGVNEAGGLKKTLFETAYATKLENLKSNQFTHAVWDPLVFRKVAARLGGRVRLMVTGSAPISVEVINFLRICFSCPVLEGYGQTECGAASHLTALGCVTYGVVGTPICCNEVKLVDVPEMGYLATDKHPRGEVCFRGPNVFAGYYKNEEKTKEALDEHGWLHSGDIGLIDDDGNLKIIDRKKNIFKLSQGEYVAPEKIENIFVRSPLVAQSFVYGDSLQSQLVAIIIPDFEVVKPWASKEGLSQKEEELCKEQKLKDAIMESITKLSKESKLKGFEMVKAIHLHPEPFSVQNDLLTPTFKLKRPQASKFFKSVFDELYASIAEIEKK